MQNHTVSRRDMLKLTGLATVFGLFTPIFHVFPVQAAEKQGKKPLIVYFSMPETDNPHNMSREEENSTVVINGKVLGNTQYVAQLIQEMTGGDIVRSDGKAPAATFPPPCRRNRIPQTTVPLSIWPGKNRNRTPARPLWERSKRPKSTTPSLSGIPTGGATCR